MIEDGGCTLKYPKGPAEAVRVSQRPASVVPYLKALSELFGSDLHCKVGSPPRVRIDGKLRRLDAPELTADDTAAMLAEIMLEDVALDFARTSEADFAYSLPGSGASGSTRSGRAGRPGWSSAGSPRARSRSRISASPPRSARSRWNGAAWCSSPARPAPARPRRWPAW
jgi:hypothetical protein